MAGPVYAAAVSLRSEAHLDKLTDSKLISEKRREVISPMILEAHDVCIASASVDEIDEINILQASLLAMRRAVLGLAETLKVQTGHILVDGNQKIPGLQGFQQTTFVKGDLRVAPISAASIVAKVARDRLMIELGKEFPQYAFESHKGYASEVHRQAIAGFGPTSHHRKTFAGVREHLFSGSRTLG